MGVVQATFQAYLGPRNYHFYNFLLAYLAEKNEFAIAERCYTRKTYGDYKYGGFCVGPDGGSINSTMNRGQNAEHSWESRLEWHQDSNVCFMQNVHANIERLKSKNTDIFILLRRQ